MTTFVDFAPSPNSLFTFQATLDGQQYTVIVSWNLWGARWYVNIFTVGGAWIVTIPQIASPLDYDINLVAGYFTTSTLVWRVDNGQFEINP